MAQLAQRPATTSTAFIGLALAASLLGGIAGGAIAVSGPDRDPGPHADEAAQADGVKWITYGEDWERRYRRMYPIIEQFVV
jgi:hypothetical protein